VDRARAGNRARPICSIFASSPTHPSYDARNYFQIAEDINRNGLFSKFFYSDLRTYAYPLFLGCCCARRVSLHVPVGWLMFEMQLALYLIAAYFVRQRLVTLWPAFAGWAFHWHRAQCLCAFVYTRIAA
jgi:hypothetical protein